MITTEDNNDSFFEISLAQWSLHRSFYGKSLELPREELRKIRREGAVNVYQGELNPIDFAVIAKRKFGIEAVEYVNQFFFTKAEDTSYLNELITRSKGEGVKNLLIMCDAEGNLGNLNDTERVQAVENHYKWVNAAKYLGCHSIRVNAAGQGTYDEVKDAAIDGIGRLTDYASKEGINVIVENHGGYSSNGQWLTEVIQKVNNSYCGTLPDFGNFCIEKASDGCANEYDRYQGVKELLPYAKGLSAKTYDFDADGNETTIDYAKMLDLVKSAGFSGYIGVEYEGMTLSEEEGIKRSKALLERVRRGQ